MITSRPGQCVAWKTTLLVVSLTFASCTQGAVEVGAASEPLTDAAAGRGRAITWAACPSDFTAECAWVPLPIDHAQPEGPALPIFVAHTPAQSGHAKQQLWLLQGGPGASGQVFSDVIERLLSRLLPDTEFYVLEHRGVGESARLGCSDFESPSSQQGAALSPDELPACAVSLETQWGESLSRFSTTGDAQDLASLIKLTRTPGKPVFVYGVSYGTTRAMRLLQLEPDLVDGVILDSVVAPGVQFLSQFDQQYDPVAKELATLCAQNETCAAKLGPDPWARILSLLAKLQNGHCPDFLYRSQVQNGFSQLLMDRELRAHIFPLTYRLDRCEPLDVAVIEHYFSVVAQALAADEAADRTSLSSQLIVALSELWEDPAPTREALKQRCAEQVLCPGASVSLGEAQAYWPRYPQDGYANEWPVSQTPILALNGTLDPQTPFESARTAATALTGPNQHFVAVPWSPHGVVFSSPVATPKAPPCGAQLLQTFLADPEAEPNLACIDDLLPPFAIDADVAQQLFGVPDLWDNPEPAAEGGVPSSRAASGVSVDEHAFDVIPLGLRRLFDR